MAQMTDAEWEALTENFETASLLQAVDAVDTLRGYLNDRDKHQPPEIRDKLLKLHQLAMSVINEGHEGRAPALFELATEIEDEIADMMEALTTVQDSVTRLTALQPESLLDGDEDEADED
jgi:hypothetical protein